MANLFITTAAVLCLATAVQAQAQAQAKPLTLDASGQLVLVEFVFDNNVRKTRDLPTSYLRVTRKKMISGADLSFKELQALADAGDGLAAYRLAKLLEERAEPDPKGIAAHYYAIAAYTGRAFAVPQLARLLKAHGTTYGPSRLKHALNAMTVQALSGNAEAATLLGQMYSDGAPFGYDLAQAETYFGMSPDGANPKAVLQLGLALLADGSDAANGHPGARSALTLAAEGNDLSVRVTAENLLRLIDDMPRPLPEVTE